MDFMKKITKEDNWIFNLIVFLWLAFIILTAVGLFYDIYQEIIFKIEQT